MSAHVLAVDTSHLLPTPHLIRLLDAETGSEVQKAEVWNLRNPAAGAVNMFNG